MIGKLSLLSQIDERQRKGIEKDKEYRAYLSDGEMFYVVKSVRKIANHYHVIGEGCKVLIVVEEDLAHMIHLYSD
jgi:hypothetical protein